MISMTICTPTHLYIRMYIYINLTILYIYRLCNNLSSFLCNVTTLDFTIQRSDIRKHSLPLDADWGFVKKIAPPTLPTIIPNPLGLLVL